MKSSIVVAVLCIAAGFAAARWLPLAPSQGAHAPETAATGFDPSAPTDARLAELERAISEERQARQWLEEELVYVHGELERLQTDPEQSEPAPDAAAQGPPADDRRARLSRRDSPDSRMARLTDAGFADDRAQWIVRRESELQMQALNARYDAARNGSWAEYGEMQRERSDTLRSELGDADYERYLDATGRPTSVAVGSVLESSPAQRAGLRPGDRILSYAGERVFSMSDLNRATYQGQAGETVMVGVLRDGTTLQLALPRGPVGIMGGGRFRPR